MQKAPRTAASEAAAAAAALIARDRLRWSDAKRAVLESTGILPDDALVASEIRRWCALFEPQRHAQLLAVKRRAALALMEALPSFRPMLTGHVLSGAATADTAVTVWIGAPSEKDVEIALLNLGLEYDVLGSEGSGRSASVSYLLEVRGENAVLTVSERPPRGTEPREPDAWQRPEEARGRLGIEGLRALLGATSRAD
jgi:hypothetical protein